MSGRRLPSILTRLTPVAMAVALGLGVTSVPAQAAPDPVTAPAYSYSEPGTEHIQSKPLAPKDLGPLPASTAELHRDYNDPSTVTEPTRPSTMGFSAQASCTPGDFGSRTGAALVSFIKVSTTECINSLFSLTGTDARGAFQETQMVSVANGFAANASSYPGDNSTNTAQLVLYLRAGYFVQWYHSGDVGEYGPSLKAAIQDALDRFWANGNSGVVNDANGETLSETVTLIDSSGENARYIYVIKRLLNGYNSSYDPYYWMLNSVNGVFTILWRGHQIPEFVDAVQADPSLLNTVGGFASNHIALLSGDQAYLVANAGRELARFIQYPDLLSTTRPLAKDLLDRSSITGPTARLWVGVAEMADYYDGANCSYYGVCDLANRLSAAALPISYTCGDSIKIRAQSMSSSDLASACTSLTGQDAYFHGVVKDSGPVADDNNTTIEVNVFDSSTDYQTYAGAIFGIDTNNGGMYLEGDPTAVGNQPRFIAYEAEWQRPTFAIWNLNHEYTHYLDGRFDMYGDFSAGVTTPTIWWVEGFAEYVSYSYRQVEYTDAEEQAALGTYTLRTLFDTTYENSDTTRVYNWGYLAVRFMLQYHRSDVDTILGYYRTGQWNAARSYLTSTIGTAYDAEWASWLTACGTGDCGSPTDPGTPTLPECTGSDTRALGEDCQRSNLSVTANDYKYLYIYVPADVTTLTITASGGTGDCDLYYNANGWATTGSYTQRSDGTDNGETITVSNPASGYRYVSLYGKSACSGVAVGTRY